MSGRRIIEALAVVWAIVGAAVAIGSLDEVNDDARAFVFACGVVGPLAAVWAYRMLVFGHDRRAGALLLVSVATPTFFAWVLNVPALVAGVALIVGYSPLKHAAGSVG